MRAVRHDACDCRRGPGRKADQLTSGGCGSGSEDFRTKEISLGEQSLDVVKELIGRRRREGEEGTNRDNKQTKRLELLPYG